jgi:hypothetical protein
MSSPSSSEERDVAAMFSDIPDPVKRAPIARDRHPHPPTEPSPTRADFRSRRMVAIVLSIAWLAAMLVLLGVRQSIAPSIVLFHIAIPSALGVVALGLSLSRGRLGLGPSVRNAVLFALVPPAIFLVIGLVFQAPMGAEDQRDKLQCGAVEALAGLVSLAIAAIGLARSQVTNGRWRGALLGSAIGLVWAGLWGIHCADSSRAHVVLAHGLPVLVFAGAGGVILSRVSRAS